MKNFIISLLIIVVIAVLAGAGFVYSGVYNVAATSKEPALVSWVLSTTRERSIERHSSAVIVPSKSELDKPESLREGFEHYDEMCVICHGAPGVKPGEARDGLNPQPPLLAKLKDLATDPPGEVFWVIKNGIKMTAMPAWGPTHSNDKIWDIVAFVQKLPNMSAEEYKTMQQKYGGAGHDEDHDHEHSDHDEDHPHTH